MKNVNIITRKAKRDFLGEMKRDGFIEIRGELEVFGTKNGKVIHYDKGDNQVTICAKHATMHHLTNENYSSHGVQRSFDAADHQATAVGEGVNNDGTLLSGEQYFSSNTSPDFSLDSRWSKNTVVADDTLGDEDANGDASYDETDLMFPFAPTKMLFGTGFEWENWAAIASYDTANSTNYESIYTSEGWDQVTFDSNISDALNIYSETWSGTGNVLTKTRTTNDIYSATLTNTVTDQEWGIRGAVKNGTYNDSAVSRDSAFGGTPSGTVKTFQDGDGREFLIKDFAGIGNPAFIYPTRENRFFEPSSEIALTADPTSGPVGDIENKITFQVVMPEQTGANADIFYPYNGYMLKEAGLFADARLLLGNKDPGTLTGRELDLYEVMPHGIMYAKRNISPILKSHDVAITSRWTLYL